MTAGDGSRVSRPLGEGAATLAIVGAAFGFGSIAIATVLATRAGTTLVALLLGRYAIAAVLLLPVVGGARGLAIGRGRALPLLVAGGVGQAIVAVLSLSALAYIPAATLVFLFYTFPAWVAIFARLRGTESITPTRVIALALALAGIVVMVGMPGAATLNPLGVALGLSAALAYGIYIPLVNRLQRGVGSTVATWYICAGVAVILGVAGVARAELSWAQPMAAWWAMLWLALVSTTFAFVLFLRGLATLGPVRTSIVSTAEPFFVAIMGALFLDQPLTLPVILGGLFIAAAVVLLQRGSPPPAPAASGRRATPSGSR